MLRDFARATGTLGPVSAVLAHIADAIRPEVPLSETRRARSSTR